MVLARRRELWAEKIRDGDPRSDSTLTLGVQAISESDKRRSPPVNVATSLRSTPCLSAGVMARTRLGRKTRESVDSFGAGNANGGG